MTRPISKLAPGWWDYTTLDGAILNDAASLNADDLVQLSRPGFQVSIYDTVEEFYVAEALEYVQAWQQATADNPAGICGPIGPTEQLPLVARIVNAIGLNLRHAHFWGMDEWYDGQRPVPITHPLSFARCDMDLCFNRIDAKLRMPPENLHFPTGDLEAYTRRYEQVRCLVMQGGQGEIKHWAFNDPPKREGKHVERAAVAAGISLAAHAHRQPAPGDHHPERPHVRRRKHGYGAGAGRHRRAVRDVEGPAHFHLAPGASRQSVRHAADSADDLQAHPRLGRADVAAGRPPRCAIQLSPQRDRERGRRDALNGRLFALPCRVTL